MTEQFSNYAAITLAANMLVGDTTATLSSGASLPATGNFRLLVGNEIMLATARSGNVVTVTRGQEGTSAAPHTAGDPVIAIVTAGALSQFFSDVMTSATSAGSSAGSSAGATAGASAGAAAAADTIILASDTSEVITQSGNVLVSMFGLTADRTVTLPGAPSTGQKIRVKDRDGSLASHAITVLHNGKSIDNVAADFVMGPATIYGANSEVMFEYDGAQWCVL